MKKYFPIPQEISDGNLLQTRLRGSKIQFLFNPRTYMGWFLYYRGLYEEKCVQTCLSFLKSGDVFLDIGANYGLYTVLTANKVGTEGKVIAFEPQRRLAEIVARNLQLNGFKNTEVHRLALSNDTRQSCLYMPSRSNDGAATLLLSENERHFGEPEEVQVRRLDDVIDDGNYGKITGMKIDVEGAELNVLEGGTKLFESNSLRFVLFEAIDDHLTRFKTSKYLLFNFFWERNFTIYVLQRNRWRQVSPDNYRENRFQKLSDFFAIRDCELGKP